MSRENDLLFSEDFSHTTKVQITYFFPSSLFSAFFSIENQNKKSLLIIVHCLRRLWHIVTPPIMYDKQFFLWVNTNLGKNIFLAKLCPLSSPRTSTGTTSASMFSANMQLERETRKPRSNPRALQSESVKKGALTTGEPKSSENEVKTSGASRVSPDRDAGVSNDSCIIFTEIRKLDEKRPLRK